MVVTTGTSASGPNPLQADPELKALLEESKGIRTTAQFDRWKKSFLRRVDDILRQDGDGAERAAKSAYNRVSTEMDSFGRKVLKLQMCVKNGSVSPTRISVRGQNSLNEVKDGATQAMNQLIKWMPAVKKEEEALGYTKWVLGAVLVRNGFEIYDTMIICRDTLKQVKTDCLNQIADRQTLDAIDYYGRQIERFCSVMSDLGLMELMMRSHDLRESSGWAKNKMRSLSGNLEFMVSPLKQKREEVEPAGRSFADGMDHIDAINIDSDSESETECVDQDLDDEIIILEESESENTELDEGTKAPGEEVGEAEYESPRDISEDQADVEESDQTEIAAQTEDTPRDVAKDETDGERRDQTVKADQTEETPSSSEEDRHTEDEKSVDASGQENDDPKQPKDVNEKQDNSDCENSQDAPPVVETEAKNSEMTKETEQAEQDDREDAADCPDDSNDIKDTEDEADNKEKAPVDDDAANASNEAEPEPEPEPVPQPEPEPEPKPKEEKSGQGGGGDGPPRPHLRVQFGAPHLKKYDRTLRHDDCVMVPVLFGKEEDLTNYYSLVEEITKLQQKGVPNANWALSSDGSHMVCEDATMSKSVETITAKICKYFQIRKDSVLVKVDMFRDGGDTKPPEHDVIAYKPKKKAVKRNIAVHVSFGVERELSLSTNGETSMAVYFPQRNNWAFSIGRDVNVRFENGIAKSDGPCEKGRVCVRLYGKAKAVVDEDGSPDLLERDVGVQTVVSR